MNKILSLLALGMATLGSGIEMPLQKKSFDIPKNPLTKKKKKNRNKNKVQKASRKINRNK